MSSFASFVYEYETRCRKHENTNASLQKNSRFSALCSRVFSNAKNCRISFLRVVVGESDDDVTFFRDGHNGSNVVDYGNLSAKEIQCFEEIRKYRIGRMSKL